MTGQKIKSWRRRWFTLSRSVLIYRDEEGTTVKGVFYYEEEIFGSWYLTCMCNLIGRLYFCMFVGLLVCKFVNL